MGTVRSKVFGIEADFLKDRKAFDFWYSQMPSYRREKIDRIKPESGKILSLAAGILLFRGFKEFGIDGASVFYGENGKPYIDTEGADSLYFNLSHSGSMAVCAFSDSEVGIDIEQNKSFKDSLIDYVFDEREALYIRGKETDCGAMNALFTSLWTKKESIMKYYGKGITMGPKSIFVDALNCDKVYYENSPKEDIHLFTYTYKDYQICVCSGQPEFPAEIELLTEKTIALDL